MSKDKKRKSVETRLIWEAMPLHQNESEPRKQKVKQVSVLTFTISGEVLAIRIEHTEGVVDCQRISPLPSPPDPIIGVASVRGRMTLVLDLSLNTSRKTASRRLILIKGEAQLGLLADRVEGVQALSPKKIRPISISKELSSSRNSKGEWSATAFFKRDGLRVPIIDVQRLADI